MAGRQPLLSFAKVVSGEPVESTVPNQPELGLQPNAPQADRHDGRSKSDKAEKYR